MKVAFQRNNRFEHHILRFICVIGILRMLVEFYSNYVRNAHAYGWWMDIGLTAMMCIVILLSYTNLNERWLTYTFSTAGGLFLIISWINQGGLYGRSEYNFMALVMVVGVLHSGRSLKVFLSIVLIIQLAIVLIWEIDFSIVEPFVITFSQLKLHYVGVMIVMTLFISYLSYLNDQEVRELDKHNLQLLRRGVQLDIENANLINQQKEYEKINDTLEAEIARRKKALDVQNTSLKAFMEISLKEFYPPMQETLKSIKSVHEKNAQNESVGMLYKSGHSLAQAYEGIKSKLSKNVE